MAGGGIGFVLGLIAVVFVQYATAQTVHIVGDTTGWRVPPQGGAAFYSAWAAKNSFVLGDSLRFNFPTTAHDVLEVSKESFDTCRFDANDDDVLKTGPATVVLDDVGMHYFICTIGQHCSAGQKLSINVTTTRSVAAGAPTSPSVSQPPPSSSVLPPPSPSSSNAVMASLYVTFSAILMALF